MFFLANTHCPPSVNWMAYSLDRPPSLCFFLPSIQVFFLSLLPLHFFSPSLFWNTLLDQDRTVDHKWRVIISPHGPRQLVLSGGHPLPACTRFFLSGLSLSLPIHLTSFSFLSICFFFCHHNLPHFWPRFFLFCFHPFCYFLSLLFYFSSHSFPFLPHRSGCSCGTRQDKSDFVASSPVTSGTLRLLSLFTTSQVCGLLLHLPVICYGSCVFNQTQISFCFNPLKIIVSCNSSSLSFWKSCNFIFFH